MLSLSVKPGMPHLGGQERYSKTRTGASAIKASPKALPPAKPPHLLSKPSLERLKRSILVRDRVTDNQFELDRKALEKVRLPEGGWVAIEKKHPDEVAVEYFDPHAKTSGVLKIKAMRIGPVSGEKPEYLEVPFDENGETHRLQVII